MGGVGLDFNSNLIAEISKVRGANYFSVHSSADFYQKLSAEFDYFVFAMVFDLCLTLQSEGNEVCIADVHGSNEIDVGSGQIMNIKTLFPSPPDLESGDVKGGIVLIKLAKLKNYNDLVIECSFEDDEGKKYKNNQSVVIEFESADEFYANMGNRKGILLSRYVVLLKQWIKECGHGNKIYAISTSKALREKLIAFCKYFESEMKVIGDKTLQKEVKILKKIINCAE